MDCEEHKSVLLEYLPKYQRERGARIISFERKDYLNFLRETSEVFKPFERYRTYPHLVGSPPEYYDTFYGYGIWFQGKIITTPEFFLKEFRKSDEYHTVYWIVKRHAENSACLFRLFLKDAGYWHRKF